MNLSEEQFPVTIIKKGSQYYGIIKELSLLEADEDLSKLYEKIQLTKTTLLQQYKDANLEHFFSKEEIKSQKTRFSITYSINFLIFSLILMIPILSILNPLSALLSRSKAILEKAASMSSTEFIVKLSQKIQDMPEERKREFKEALHTIAAEARPFIDELSNLDLNRQEIANQ